MRKLNLFFVAISVIAITISSCGSETKSDNENDQNKAQSQCKGGNEIAVEIRGYEYGMSIDDFEFDAPVFEVKQVDYRYENDSNATIKLMNYSEEDVAEGRKPQFVDINIDLRAKDGAKLRQGQYKYNDYDCQLWSRVTLITDAGIVWFNWVMGMPSQGYVEIKHICPDEVCGKLNLNVEKPEDANIGIVKVNGTFSYSTVEE